MASQQSIKIDDKISKNFSYFKTKYYNKLHKLLLFFKLK